MFNHPQQRPDPIALVAQGPHLAVARGPRRLQQQVARQRLRRELPQRHRPGGLRGPDESGWPVAGMAVGGGC